MSQMERSVILTCIRKWLALYKKHGTDELCMTDGTYSGDFKVSVVEYMQDTDASLQLTAAHFNIPFKESVILSVSTTFPAFGLMHLIF